MDDGGGGVISGVTVSRQRERQGPFEVLASQPSRPALGWQRGVAGAVLGH